MKRKANIRLSGSAILEIEYDDSNFKLTAKEISSGKSGSVTLTTGSKKSAPKEEE